MRCLRHHRPPRPPRRGFFLTDTITGLGILLVMTLVLASAMSHFRKGTDRLADTRQATRMAEQAMLALQSGQTAPTPGEGDSVEIVPLDQSTDLPAGCTWVRIRAKHNGRVADLIGVVKSDAVKGARP